MEWRWCVEARLASLKAIFTLAANSMTHVSCHAAVQGHAHNARNVKCWSCCGRRSLSAAIACFFRNTGTSPRLEPCSWRLDWTRFYSAFTSDGVPDAGQKFTAFGRYLPLRGERVPCQTKLRNGKLKCFLTVSVPSACGKSNCCEGWTDGNAFASLISAAMNSCLTNSRKPCGNSWMRSRGDCPMAIGSPVLRFFGDFTPLLALDR